MGRILATRAMEEAGIGTVRSAQLANIASSRMLEKLCLIDHFCNLA